MITSIRKKIFYGMIIRYIIVNALKLNFTCVNGVRESTDRIVSITLLVILQLVPFILSYVLKAITENLDDEDTE